MRGINLKEALSRQLRQLRDGMRAIIDREGQAPSVDDTGLAHGNQLLSRKFGIRNGQAASVMTALQPLAQIVQRRTKAVPPKGIGQIGKFFSLGHEYAVQPHGFRVEKQVDRSLANIQQRMMEVTRIVIHQSCECLELGARLFDDKGRKKVSFAREVIVERTFGHAGFTGDMRHGRAFIAVCQKDFSRTVQNLFALSRRQRGSLVFRGRCARPWGLHKALAPFRYQTAMRIMLTELVGQCKIISVSGV